MHLSYRLYIYNSLFSFVFSFLTHNSFLYKQLFSQLPNGYSPCYKGLYGLIKASLFDTRDYLTIQPLNNWVSYLVAFFLLATVLRLPLRVRELFLVLCPRNGSPLRWRIPR